MRSDAGTRVQPGRLRRGLHTAEAWSKPHRVRVLADGHGQQRVGSLVPLRCDGGQHDGRSRRGDRDTRGRNDRGAFIGARRDGGHRASVDRRSEGSGRGRVGHRDPADHERVVEVGRRRGCVPTAVGSARGRDAVQHDEIERSRRRRERMPSGPVHRRVFVVVE